MTTSTMSSSTFRLCAVSLDGFFRSQADEEQKREQAVAIFDLLDNNTFVPVGHDGGPYRLGLALADGRLVIPLLERASSLNGLPEERANLIRPCLTFRSSKPMGNASNHMISRAATKGIGQCSHRLKSHACAGCPKVGASKTSPGSRHALPAA